MKILIVDDEQAIAWSLSRLGQRMGYEVCTASSAERALELAREEHPEIVVLDIRLPGMDGLTAMQKLREFIGEAPIIVITAHGDLSTAVEAVRHGAFEYLTKPFDLARVEQVLERAAQTVRQDSAPQASEVNIGEMVGKTPAMQEVFRRIALVAASEACVLITGESGTGKELAARAIHQHSARAQGPFVAVNVASLSPSLAESELFGHVRGAFTGADQSRTGLLVQANGGTLFLDEVAEIPLPTQVKLLRALEQGEVLPVGSSQPVKTQFRMISASHRDLAQLAQRGDFRHDLYFRLCAFEIRMPSLRQRSEDIPLLVERFLDVLSKGKQRPPLAPETMQELLGRPWYGNVRELRNTLEHALVLARGGVVAKEHLPPPAPAGMVGSQDGGETDSAALTRLIRSWAERQLRDASREGHVYEDLLSLVERPLFDTALEMHQHQYATAARVLGIHRTTLRKKVEG